MGRGFFFVKAQERTSDLFEILLGLGRRSGFVELTQVGFGAVVFGQGVEAIASDRQHGEYEDPK